MRKLSLITVLVFTGCLNTTNHNPMRREAVAPVTSVAPVTTVTPVTPPAKEEKSEETRIF